MFEEHGNVLLRMDQLDAALNGAAVEREAPPNTAPLEWPDSTFQAEPPDSPHFMGSHWDPFFESSDDVFGRLRRILDQADPHPAHRKAIDRLNHEPADWVKGVHFVWPEPERGLIATCSLAGDKKALECATVYPFFPWTTPTRLTLNRVIVWRSGVEAQIDASCGKAGITFFDTLFLPHRGPYVAGKEYQFLLTGIAYNAGPPRHVELPYKPNPDLIAWQRFLAERRGEPPPEIPRTITLGSAILMPIPEWDRDDYQFRAQVRSVQEVRKLLVQDGWLVRATVMRLEEDFDLDILITHKAWQGDQPPFAGQEIEGRLWLQGALATDT